MTIRLLVLCIAVALCSGCQSSAGHHAAVIGDVLLLNNGRGGIGAIERMTSGIKEVRLYGRSLNLQPEHLEYHEHLVSDLQRISSELQEQGRTAIEIEDAQCRLAERQLKNAPTPTYPRADSIVGAVKARRDFECLGTDHRFAQAERARKQEVVDAAAREVAAQREAQRNLVAQRQAEWDRKRQKEIAKACPKGLGDFGELVFANPYDVKGRCYGFVGKTLQVLDRSIGLYQLGRDKNVYIDFGGDAAPSQFFSGFVKGVGVFSYTTVMGAKMIVPSLVVAELPPEDLPAIYGD